MDEIITERFGSILRVELNRPTKRNAMTSSMYVTLADVFNEAAKDERTRVVLWHGAGDSFCAGNDLEDFLKNPPGPGESPQARLMNALLDFDKPLIAAVQGAAIGGGTTMLTHCDFVYAGESAKFQMPFINLAVVPEFGSSCSVPARIGHIRAAELILLGLPFDARRAADLGFVTQVVPDQNLLATATETARKLAAKPASALQASKRLMKRSFREQIKAAMTGGERRVQRASSLADAKEALDGVSGETPPSLYRDGELFNGRVAPTDTQIWTDTGGLPRRWPRSRHTTYGQVPRQYCRIQSAHGRELGSGLRGELVARGANVMRGYWNDPEETRLAFRDGMFRTGDIGYRDADGYFYILDRVKDMIVTGGENVYCGEVEAVIYEHPAVLEAAVFGIPDPQWGELVAACVVRKPGTNLSTDDLIAHCRRFLANYKIPRHIEFSKTELPKSGSGKILKRLLRERFWVGQKRAVG